ncbi:MAG TPA: GNAT family N-acetyltransferase [Gemmatimonadales bacterium]|nr:GNAT family N-acetyltransferase [Gemmatimonadales bacterium]
MPTVPPACIAALATTDDIDAVFELLANAGRHLTAQGFRNWETPYPRARITTDIEAGAIVVVRRAACCDGRLAATYSIRRDAVRVYVPEPWTEPHVPARYLNRLAVDPALQGTGIGAWCLTHLEREARREGVRAIRCDVLTENYRLRRFYERWGYVARGARSHSGWDFTCYERELG